MASPRKQKPRSPAQPDPEGYTYDELLPLVRTTLEAGISVLVRGHPGVGKSALAAEVAAAMGLPMQDIRLAQRDPAELGGVYFPDRERRELALLPPSWVREVCERPGFVFLDELNAAVTRLHQAAAYQIVLERRVGDFRFHPETVVMAAGNLEEDGAIVSPLSSALCNRFAHFVLRVHVPTWLRWAGRAGISPVIVAYMRAHERYGEDILYAHDATGASGPDGGADAFPSPRSWAMASRVLERGAEGLRKRLVAACVGAAAADRLFAFQRIYDRVNPERIITHGRTPDFTAGPSAEPSFAHATVSAVANWLVQQPAVEAPWLDNLMALLRAPGLDPEYVFLLLRELKAKGDLTERLKVVPGYRELAGDLVQLHAGLYQ